jgi:predicted alpha/beta-hydrolase family hydrolase
MTSLLLFPGAGSNRENPALLAIERAATAAMPKLRCVRADFPYRKAGRRAPDPPAVLLRTVREEAKALGRGRLVLGGRSMGGRICSMAVGDADAPLRAAGLVLVSYPLHPPGRPDRLRVEHLPRVTVPCLFVHGTKDPFGAPDELTEWTATIPGDVEHVWIDGRGHELRGADQVVAAAVTEWLGRLLR